MSRRTASPSSLAHFLPQSLSLSLSRSRVLPIISRESQKARRQAKGQIRGSMGSSTAARIARAAASVKKFYFSHGQTCAYFQPPFRPRGSTPTRCSRPAIRCAKVRRRGDNMGSPLPLLTHNGPASLCSPDEQLRSCLICCGLCCEVVPCQALAIRTLVRLHVAHKYQIKEDIMNACCLTCFCPCCSDCQVQNEIITQENLHVGCCTVHAN